jgi:hypothetical protein
MQLSSGTVEAVDYRAVFEKSPHLQMLLDPSFIIVAVTDALVKVTMVQRERMLGRYIFEAFPDNPNYDYADGVSNLQRSLLRVLQARAADEMPAHKYDIPHPGLKGRFEERYWQTLNWPILDEDGFVCWIVHQVEDVTTQVLSGEFKRARHL